MLNRRAFLIVTGAGLAAPAAPAAASSRRRVFPMNRNWRYGGKAVDGATAPGFDDRRFERVTLPHANRVLPWHGFDDREYEFVSVYRRHFRLPAELKGQRVFIDFAGVMTAATVTLNGQRLGQHLGGYTPFSFEMTPRIHWSGDNLLAVEVDSTERKDIPPFGDMIDYLTFGGIYREVSLRVVPPVFIENVFARPVDMLAPERRLDVRCYLDGQASARGPLNLAAELRDGARVIKSASQPVAAGGAGFHSVSLEGLGDVQLWSLEQPKLYEVVVRLTGGDIADEYTVRTGLREARFTEKGFYLNGRHVKLRGLNRHQTFPYVGGAMPARVQRRDALILRKELKCNIVRTSHYPQSPHFLDACDEAGLLVFEEIPGWQHIGDQAWQDLSVRNAGQMVRRDWNHPSIVLWGVRINESRDNHDFYVRTNDLARKLDPSRQTGGVRNNYASELLEDVFTMNDFPWPMRPPNHPLYLNTEFNGHMWPVHPLDNIERITEHVIRHARVHDHLASDDRYAGGIGWCAFDYNTHSSFGAGDRMCYHGVSDIFRIAKPAAGVYRSQCDPEEEIVLEPGFYWSWGDRAGGNGPGRAPICSNCDQIKVYANGKLLADLTPDRQQFPHLPHPPFTVPLDRVDFDTWGDLKMEGYVGGKLLITRTLTGRGADARFLVEPDDTELVADGSDATRIVLRVTDEYGSRRQLATGAISLSVEGPGEIIGENPFALFGGVGAVWLKAKETAGAIRLTARHPVLGAKTVTIQVTPAPPEGV